MVVSPIQSVGINPSAEMDRKGVSENILGESPLAAAWGFEASLLALLNFSAEKMPVNSELGFNQDSTSSNLAFQSLSTSLEQNMPVMKNAQEIDPKSSDLVLDKNDSGEAKIDLLKLVKMGFEGIEKNVSENSKEIDLEKIAKSSENQSSISPVSVENMEVLSDEEVPSMEFHQMLGHKDLVSNEGISLDLKSKINLQQKLEKPMALKNMADSLYIQRHLSSEVSFQLPELKAEISHETPVASQVGSNLIQDMDAFITKVIETKEGGRVNLQLRPGNLGEVQIQVDVQSDSVRIQMDADNQMAQDVLRSQSGELKQQLQNVGLKIDELQIGMNIRSENSDLPKDGQNREHQHFHQQQKHQQNSDREFFMEDYSSSELMEG